MTKDVKTPRELVDEVAEIPDEVLSGLVERLKPRCNVVSLI